MQMQTRLFLLISGLSAVFMSCGKQKETAVVNQRYIHKYGYALSKEEWDSKNYPGQVITTLKDGVTVVSTYENGLLHGPCTYSHPHSQIVQHYYLYNEGNLVKELSYDITGMPVHEEIQLSPTRYSLTLWYADGTPMSSEEYASEELLEGEYFTKTNESEARVEKGYGRRVRRDREGVLLNQDEIESGYLAKRETFYRNGAPESVATYVLGKLHGEKRTFTSTGEPLTTEEYVDSRLHGKSTYFKNGVKILEVSYLNGQKNGMEVHFIDGEKISQEVHWENDKKHGETIYYIEDQPHVEWYYDGEQVSQEKFKELNRLDEMISQISPELQMNGKFR